MITKSCNYGYPVQVLVNKEEWRIWRIFDVELLFFLAEWSLLGGKLIEVSKVGSLDDVGDQKEHLIGWSLESSTDHSHE